MKRLLICGLLWCSLTPAARGAEIKIVSPDRRYVVRVDDADGLHYTVHYAGEAVVLRSPLGYREAGKTEVWKITGSSQRSVSDSWRPVYGERAVVKDRYNERTAVLGEGAAELVVRAYDEGVAFCFRYGPGTHRITGSATAVTLPAGSRGWFADRAQAPYRFMPVAEYRGEAERPLVALLPSGGYVCLAEARMVDFARTKYRAAPETPGRLLCSMAGEAVLEGPCETPWQVVMAAREPAEFLNNNDLILNLNPPCAIDDPSWIRPGKVMREVTLSAAGARELTDFAVRRNIDYIHFDAGWYGYEYDPAADATTVTVDPKRNPESDLDLPEAIRYAREKGKGVILYVNHLALERQLDTLLPLFRSWGVAGIKFGFVNTGSQHWTQWLHEAVRKCARYGMVVDVHDEYRPTGFSRTWPNLLTQEGVRGNEEFDDATHDVTQAFIRFVAGAADNTICYYRQNFNRGEAMRDHEGKPMNAKTLKTTSAHQLALAVVYYSPLQYLYWYDRPSDSRGEPELAFFDRVPTVWDDTKVLGGEIGKWIVTARRSGDEWFVGGLAGNEGCTTEIPLDFLDRGKRYRAVIYSDGGPETGTRTRVAVDTLEVTRKTVLRPVLRNSGGVAVHLVPGR